MALLGPMSRHLVARTPRPLPAASQRRAARGAAPVGLPGARGSPIP